MKIKFPGLIFIVLLLAVTFLYDYHNIAIKRPQSVHAWRQADGASLAMNYAETGMRFFQPEVHNLTSDNGTTGKSATSEIPLLYYFVAVLYKIFGSHEYIYRILNTLIFLTGLFYLFKGIRLYTTDIFWSMSIPLAIFTSPVLAYYGNNYLSNTSAFSMVFIAWFYAFRYIKFHKIKDLWGMLLFFFLAGAMKVTGLFSFFALFGIFILEWTGIFRPVKEQKTILHTKAFLIGGILILLPILAWILYAQKYNENHSTTYFSTTIFPIWHFNSTQLKDILSGIGKLWEKEIFHPSLLYFLGGSLLFILFFNKKVPRLFILLVLFLFLEIVLYFALQFWTFRDHDYYTINMFILPVFIFISFAELVKTSNIRKSIEYIVKIAFSILLIYNILEARDSLSSRYTGYMNNNYRRMIDYYSISPILRENGISREDTIISFSDFSHVSLYLMDQKGWTRYTDMKYNRGEPYRYNQDSAGIQLSIDKGAKYLIINGFGDLFSNKFLKSFTRHLVLNYKNILVFEPENSFQNFRYEERDVMNYFLCSAENRDSTGKYFIDSTGSILFENGNTQCNEHAFSEKFSIKLNKDQRYGMTLSLKQMQYGESVYASVWKKGEVSKGAISVQTDEYYLFHMNSNEPTGREKDGWMEIKIDFFIPYEAQGKDVKIFLYNPEEEPVYFDDLRIYRYESIL